MSAVTEYEALLRRLERELTRLRDAPGEQHLDPGAKRHILDVLRLARDALGGQGPLSGPRAADLAHLLADGNGPRDPTHPFTRLVDSLDEAREAAAAETGRLPLLTRTMVRQFREARREPRTFIPVLLRYGAYTPSRGGPVGLRLRSGGSDMDDWLPVFSDADLAAAWSGTQPGSRSPRASIVHLRTLAVRAIDLGLPGLIVNPQHEALRLSRADIEACPLH